MEGVGELGASPFQLPPKPIVGTDLAGQLSTAIQCHQSAVWGQDGGAGDNGVGLRDADVPGDGDWDGEAWLVLPWPGKGRVWEPSPVHSSKNLSLLSKRCWALHGRAASLFVRA